MPRQPHPHALAKITTGGKTPGWTCLCGETEVVHGGQGAVIQAHKMHKNAHRGPLIPWTVTLEHLPSFRGVAKWRATLTYPDIDDPDVERIIHRREPTKEKARETIERYAKERRALYEWAPSPEPSETYRLFEGEDS